MTNRVFSVLAPIGVISIILFASAVKADWPTYGHDPARSGVTYEPIETPLYLQWVYMPKNPPQPAWPEPGKEVHRIDFDYVYQVAIAGGTVYFGSSADNKVYAIDLATGKERWSFFTDAPVRFAPTVYNGRVFATSDDGFLYCLSVDDGELLWEFRPPGDDMLLGNGRMISRWPMRTGAIVEDGIVYVTAGMWPAEGVYIYALNARNGDVIWKNDTSNCMYIKQPHDPGVAMTGVAPQGYIVASEDKLIVPTGRNLPAVFDRKTGRLLYYWAGEEPHRYHGGGSRVMAWGDLMFCEGHPYIVDQEARTEPYEPTTNGMIIYDLPTGKQKIQLQGMPFGVVEGQMLYTVGSGSVRAIDLKKLVDGEKIDDCTKWRFKHGRPYSLIMAGRTLFVGGSDTVAAISSKGQPLWTGTLDGQVRGLAVSDGRLVVSTSEGAIACFASKKVAEPAAIKTELVVRPYPDDKMTEDSVSLAENIIKETRVTAGYCLNLGAGHGRLAYQLAKQMELNIYCAESDSKKAAAAREALDAAGIYGMRVTVHQIQPAKLPYASYFADLIVSSDGYVIKNGSAEELYRVLRPCGGAAYLLSDVSGGVSAQEIRDWLSAARVPQSEIHEGKLFIKVVRGPLPGAGEWTHQYADLGRTGCADDKIVKWPMNILWFGGPGPGPMHDRHWRTSPPVSANGRLFVTGQHTVMGINAYNGHELWRRKLQNVAISGTSSRGANIAVDKDSVYLGYGSSCYRIDAATGEDRNVYEMPINVEEKNRWQYVAVSENLVFGTLGIEDVGRYAFAVGKEDGKIRWKYEAEQGVYGQCIAIGDGRLFLLDKASQKETDRQRRRGLEVSKSKLVALDARTGEVLWSDSESVVDARMVWFARGVALVSATDRMTAFSGEDGKALWQRKLSPRTFPIIVEEKVITQPYAYDLRTGKQVTRVEPLTGEEAVWYFGRSYGCGMNSACPAAIFFRSATLGIYDLISDSGTSNYGGIRAGCYINAIPANGLLLVPEASSGCTCPYNFQTSLALAPTKMSNENWFAFHGSSRSGRVKHVAINFGAPGDRRDDEGTLWLTFPRPNKDYPQNNYNVPLSIGELDGFSYYRHNADNVEIRSTNRPMIYASGCRGLWQVKMDLVMGDIPVFPTTYTVRLHFAELDDVHPEQRVFDVMIQDRVALNDFDIVKEAGQNTALVKEFRDIRAMDSLIINFVTEEEKPTDTAAPILSGIEVIAED
jgi:outer membrane protein assembly factor BamB